MQGLHYGKGLIYHRPKFALCRSASPACSFVLFYSLSDVWLQHLFNQRSRKRSQSVIFTCYVDHCIQTVFEFHFFTVVLALLPCLSFQSFRQYMFICLYFSGQSTSTVIITAVVQSSINFSLAIVLEITTELLHACTAHLKTNSKNVKISH